MAFGTDNDVEIRVTLDTQGAATELDGLKKRFEGLGGTADAKIEAHLKGIADAAKRAAGVDGFPQLSKAIQDAFANKNAVSAEAFAKRLQDIGVQALKAGAPMAEINARIAQYADQSRKAEGAVKGVTEATGKFSVSATALGTAIGNVVGSALVALPGLLADAAGGMVKLAKAGDNFNDISQGFDDLTRKAGATADVLLGKLRQAVSGQVDDLQLMRSANDALIAGLDPEAFVKVAGAAKKYGEQLGMDTTQAINALSNAVQTGQERMLRSFGVYFDGTKAIKDYGAAHGVAKDQLDKWAAALDPASAATIKQQAVLKLLKNTTVETGDASKGAGDAFETLQVALKNAYSQVASAIDKNDSLKQGFLDLAAAIKNTDFTPLINYLTTAINQAITAADKILKLAQAIGALGNAPISPSALAAGGNLPSSATLGKVGSFQDASAAFGQKVALADSAEQIKTLAGEYAKLQEQARQLPKEMQAGAQKYLDQIEQAATAKFQQLAKGTGDATLKITGSLGVIKNEAGKIQGIKLMPEGAAKEVDKLGASVKNTAVALDGGKKQLSDYDKAVASLGDKVKALVAPQAFPELTKKTKEAVEAFKAGDLSADQLELTLQALEDGTRGNVDAINAIAQAMGEAGKATDDWGGDLEDLEKKAKEAFDAIKTGLGGTVGGAPGAGAGTTPGGAGFGSIMTDGSPANQIANAFGSSVLGAISKGGTLKSADYKQAATGFATTAGTVIASMFPVTAPFAPLIGQAAGMITGGLFGAFAGKDTAGTRDRKMLDKKIGDGLGFDLDFKGTQFGGRFEQLGGQAQAAFSGAGNALSTLNGATTEWGANLAHVLGNNLTDLNSLQIALGKLGVSFEDAQQALTQMALDGKLSFVELQSQSNALKDVFSKGIPGAVGVADKALDNLLAAGSKGGRVAVDAIGDIGSEAKEKGIKSLQELRNFLASTGKYSAEQLDKLFSTFAEHNIKTVDDLANATQDKLLPVLATLEQKGFLKDTGKGLDDLIVKIDKIPTEKDIKINIQTTVTGDGKEYLNKEGISSGTTRTGGPGLQGG